MIPSIETCFNLMDKYNMLKNIREHSIMVARTACLIAGGLKEAGEDISVKKSVVGALLHDIGKTEGLKSGNDHAEIGVRICFENGFTEIVELIKEHVRLINYHIDTKYSEKEIVFYSDKRVNHNKIVSLEERLAYILDRYAKNQDDLSQAIRINFELCKKVEEHLFRKLDFEPDALSELANNNNKPIFRQLPI